MNKTELRATHQGTLNIAQIEIPCFVLEDGRRMISQRGLQKGIGMSMGGGEKGERRIANLIENLGEKGLKTTDLSAQIAAPVVFHPLRGGQVAFGYEAATLADLCDLILQARDGGFLLKTQANIATTAEILIRSLAKVGIVALVDEATGYQEVRDRLALQKILEKYLNDEYAAWTKRFPNEFYEQLFRIKGWQWKDGSTKRPGVTANYTTDLIYDRLAPGVKEEIQKRRHEVEEETGKKIHMHRWLTINTGVPALDRHFAALLALMRATPDKNWNYLKRLVARALPKSGDPYEILED